MRSRYRASISPKKASSPRSKAALVRSMPRAKSANKRPRRRRTGSRQSRWMPLARSAIKMIGMGFAAALLALSCPAGAQGLRPYAVVGDAVPDSLTGIKGDAARGRALVVDRTSTCILCHNGPFAEVKFQGDLAPGLAGSGSRWSEGQLRLRLADASRLNAATIMPSYYPID